MRLILSGRHPRNSTYATESGQILYKVHKPHELGPGTATIRKAVGTVQGVWQGDGDQLHSPTSASSSIPTRGTQIKHNAQPISSIVTASSKGPLGDGSRDSVLVEGNGERKSSSIDDEAFAISDADEADDLEEEQTQSLPVHEGHFAFYAQIEFKTFLSSRFRFDSQDVSVNKYFRKEGWSWYGRGRVFKAKDGKEYRWELHLGDLTMVSNDGNKTRLVRYKPYVPGLGPLAKPRKGCLEVDDSCEGILDEIIMTFIYCHKLKKDRERRAWTSGAREIMRSH